MAVMTAIDFKAEVTRLFELFDRGDFEPVKQLFTDDAQGVDEISRGWIRGRAEMERYFEKLDELGVTEIHTTLSDVSTRRWDDVGLVTCVANQTYETDGTSVAITTPLSVLYRHVNDAWKIELIHAVPLPDAA